MSKTSIKTVTWTKADGGLVTLTVEAERGWGEEKYTAYADGYMVPVSRHSELCSTRITMDVAGQVYTNLVDCTADGRRAKVIPAGCDMMLVDRTGKRIYVTTANALAIRTAIASAVTEAEDCDEWREVQTRRQALDAIDASRAQVEYAMTLGGRTY